MMYELKVTPNIKIIPLSNESIGVRGFSFLIKIKQKYDILIDPSVSLAPIKKGFVPHPFEITIAKLLREKILRLSSSADLIFMTHYHGDHYTIPWERKLEFTNKYIHEKIYYHSIKKHKQTFQIIFQEHEKKKVLSKKMLFAISPKYVTWNQIKRARYLWERPLPENISLHPAENTSILLEDVEIEISSPLPHGYNEKRGNVVGILITDHNYDKKVLFSSDIEGATNPKSMNYLLRKEADVIFLDGIGFYHHKTEQSQINAFIGVLEMLLDLGKEVIMAHHFNRSEMREEFFKQYGLPYIKTVFERIMGAHFLLEAQRKELWSIYPFKEEELNPKKPYYLYLNGEKFVNSLYNNYPETKRYFEFLDKILSN